MPVMNRTPSLLSLPWFIGWRYTFSRREQRFISFVSLISLLGLILGITAMLVVLSAMNGFDRELKSRILRVIPHGYVEMPAGRDWEPLAKALQAQPGIEAVIPMISGKGMVSFHGRSLAVDIQGIDPETLHTVTPVGQHLIAGSLADLQQQPFGIVLGQLLARRLGVTTGDRVQVLLPDIQVTPAGVYPRQKSFTVVGVFSVGADPDGQLALVHINSAARLFQQLDANGQPEVRQIQVKTQSVEEADRILAASKKSMNMPDLVFTSWADTHRTLFSAIRMEKRMISLLLFVVVVVAVFNIASILVMMVAEKRKDIAILRVMGADTKTIAHIFMTQGLLVGLVGIVVGTLVGTLLALHMADMIRWLEQVSSSRWLSQDVYYIASLPNDWRIGDAMMIVVVSAILCLLATIYPAWQSSRVDPVQSLNE